MSGFRIEPVHQDYAAVYHNEIKVGIIFPARGEDELSLYPNPAAFPDLTFTGLPAPMEPRFMSFPNMEALEAFLGITQERVAA